MKNFDDLWQELDSRISSADPESNTYRLFSSGVHSIGKKIMEEAGEVWLAAEYQGKEELATEIAQLIYHLQVMAKEAKVVYHMASFLGQESVRASNASYCAVDEGRFLDFHKALYQVQGNENSGLFSNENLITIGNKLGITSETFADCVNDNKYGDFVKKVAESMKPNNVEGTPTVFINGTRWERSSSEFNVDEFKAAVEAAKR